MYIFKTIIASLAASTIVLAIADHDFIKLASIIAPQGINFLLNPPKDKKESKKDSTEDNKKDS